MALAITAAPSLASSAPLSPCYTELPQNGPAVSAPKFEPVQFTIKGIRFTTKPSACTASDKFITRVRIENPFLGATVFDPRWPFEGTLPNPEGWYVSPDQAWLNIIGRQIQQRSRALRDPEKALEALLTQGFLEKYDVDREAVLANILEPIIKEQQFGLRSYFRAPDLLKESGPIIYRQSLEDPRQIYIRCVTEKWRGAHPSCRAYIYWSQDGLGIGMSFLKDGLPHWDQMAEATRQKIIEWRD